MNTRSTIAFIIVAIAAASASAAETWTNAATGAVAPYPPMSGLTVANADAEWFQEQGWEPFTLDQQADWDAAIVAEREEAAAEAALYLQTDPKTLIPVVISTNLETVLGTARLWLDTETGELFTTTETASPPHTRAEQQAERNAAKETAISERSTLAEQVKAAKGTPSKIAAIVAYIEQLEASLGRGVE